MRVLHVITGLETGGAEQWLRQLLRHSAADAEVVALTGAGVLADVIRSDGVPVAALGMRGNRDLAALPRLVRLIRRGRYDVVHTHLYRAQVYGALAARLAGVRTVVSTEHSLNDHHIEGRPTDRPGVRALYLAAARLTTTVAAVSEPVADRLVRWGVPADKIVVTGVGIDAAALAFDGGRRERQRAELGLPPERPLVGAVGRLVATKRFDVLLRALAPVPEVSVVLLGDGPARAELAALAGELGMAARVHLLGQHLDVTGWLSAMDALASPSREETFGVALIEALASGLPVVYVTGPAVDGLPADVRARATRVASEPDQVRDAVLAALSRPRSAAPSDGFSDYDVAHLASRIDELYQRRHRVPQLGSATPAAEGGARDV
jgi:glycosyltransferase involved in cell wall biosynthesis